MVGRTLVLLYERKVYTSVPLYKCIVYTSVKQIHDWLHPGAIIKAGLPLGFPDQVCLWDHAKGVLLARASAQAEIMSALFTAEGCIVSSGKTHLKVGQNLGLCTSCPDSDMVSLIWCMLRSLI